MAKRQVIESNRINSALAGRYIADAAVARHDQCLLMVRALEDLRPNGFHFGVRHDASYSVQKNELQNLEGNVDRGRRAEIEIQV